MKLGVLLSVLVLCAAGCTRTPEPPQLDMAIYQWFIEPVGPGKWNPQNLLVSSAVADDPDVLAALESALRYGLAGAPQDSLCFLGFGRDAQGEWLDPTEALIDSLSDLPLVLVPVSEAGLNPIPPADEPYGALVLQPAVPGARCTLELREWEAGVRAVVHIHVTARNGKSAGSTAVLGKVDGVWSTREWRGGRVWSPN